MGMSTNPKPKVELDKKDRIPNTHENQIFRPEKSGFLRIDKHRIVH